MSQKFDGRIRISRVSSTGSDGDYVQLTMYDEKSRIQFLTANIPIDSFGRVVTGGPETECQVELRGVERIGCTHEHKTEFVPGTVSYTKGDRNAVAQAAIAPFEVDGWRAHLSDFGNQHRSKEKDGVKGYNVTFHRYVRPDGTPVL